MTDATKDLKPLSKKHQRFVAEYLNCFNGTRAYMKVYPKSSYEAAMVSASELLRNPNISAAIDERKDAVLLQFDESMKILSNHARGDLGDFIDDYGGIDITAARQAGRTGLLKKVESRVVRVNEKGKDTETITTRVELHDPQSAIEKILKVQGKIKPDTYELVIRYANPNDKPTSTP